MDQDIRLEKRKHILKEVSKGYFSDLNATRKHGGKTWIAPTVMIRQDKALYFPDVAGKTIANGETVHTTTLCAGRISVVSILSTKISEVLSMPQISVSVSTRPTDSFKSTSRKTS